MQVILFLYRSVCRNRSEIFLLVNLRIILRRSLTAVYFWRIEKNSSIDDIFNVLNMYLRDSIYLRGFYLEPVVFSIGTIDFGFSLGSRIIKLLCSGKALRNNARVVLFFFFFFSFE